MCKKSVQVVPRIPLNPSQARFLDILESPEVCKGQATDLRAIEEYWNHIGDIELVLDMLWSAPRYSIFKLVESSAAVGDLALSMRVPI